MDQETLKALTDALRNLLATFGAYKGVVKGLELLFSVNLKDFPTCNTRILRLPKGLLWGKQVAFHTQNDGRMTMLPIDPP